MVTTEGHLLLVHGVHEVARFIPGEVPASEPGTDVDGTVRFGARGPMLLLEKNLDEVFAQIDVGVGESPWSALGCGFAIELPADVVLLGAAPDDPEPGFELHAQGGKDHFIQFRRVRGPVNVKPAPYQQLASEFVFDAVEPDGQRRTIRVTELGYQQDGVPWRQAVMQVPVGDNVMIVTAQATETRYEHLLNAAKWVAATMGPLG